MTDERPAMAPISTAVASQSCPVASTPTAIGCGTLSFWYGTTPVRMSDTAMYRTVHTPSETRMPMGRSRCGFFASCAAVETASNPMYAKKTIVAPWRTPETPNRPNAPSFAGTKGCQFSACTNRAAKAMNSSTTVTFKKTMTVLNRADSLTPRTSKAVTARTISTAGRFKYAPVELEVLLPSRSRARARSGPRLGEVDAERVVQERDDVARPADAHGRRGDEILENEVPADDPGDELAHRRVRVRVRAAGDRDHRRHLGVAEPRERRRDAGHDEREGDRGPGVGRRGAPREHEDAGPDDRADPQHDQVERGQRALEAVLVIGLRAELIDRLRGEQTAVGAHPLSLTQPARGRIHA